MDIKRNHRQPQSPTQKKQQSQTQLQLTQLHRTQLPRTQLPRILIENNGGKESEQGAEIVKQALYKVLGVDNKILNDHEEELFEVVCDFCDNVIPSFETTKCNFTCRQGECSKSFDLCLRCQELEPQYMSECPAGFKIGCNAEEYKYSPPYSRKRSESGKDCCGKNGGKDGGESGSGDNNDNNDNDNNDNNNNENDNNDNGNNNEMFFALAEKPTLLQYAFGEKVFNVVGQRKSKNPNQDMSFLYNFLQSTGFYYLGGLLHREGTELSCHVLTDLWLHFRASDQKCIEKYGAPDKSGSLTIYNLGTWKLYHLYKQLHGLFSQFIDLDNEDNSGKPLGIAFVYPNGDEFYIRRLYGEELNVKNPSIFITQFFPFSTVPDWKSRWQDPSKERLYASGTPGKVCGKSEMSKSIHLSMGYLIPII